MQSSVSLPSHSSNNAILRGRPSRWAGILRTQFLQRVQIPPCAFSFSHSRYFSLVQLTRLSSARSR